MFFLQRDDRQFVTVSFAHAHVFISTGHPEKVWPAKVVALGVHVKEMKKRKKKERKERKKERKKNQNHWFHIVQFNI